MLGVRVDGGTDAGRKRPLEPRANDWIHDCAVGARRRLRGWFRNCPDCGARRP